MVLMRTFSGNDVDLSAPTSAMIHQVDICRGLSQIPRWNGHTNFPWSVASHSMLVAELPCDYPWDAGLRLAKLLHDAHETYIGDITTPTSQEIDRRCLKISGYPSPVAWLKADLDAVIYPAFGLPWPLPPAWVAEIKRCDALALMIEDQELRGCKPPIKLDAYNAIGNTPRGIVEARFSRALSVTRRNYEVQKNLIAPRSEEDAA